MPFCNILFLQWVICRLDFLDRRKLEKRSHSRRNHMGTFFAFLPLSFLRCICQYSTHFLKLLDIRYKILCIDAWFETWIFVFRTAPSYFWNQFSFLTSILLEGDYLYKAKVKNGKKSRLFICIRSRRLKLRCNWIMMELWFAHIRNITTDGKW